MKRMRNILILLLCAALLAGCGARSAPAKALEGCRALLGVREGFLEDRAAELAGSSIGDWLAMALSACGANESYDAYLAALERHVTERYAEQGTLDALMATEYSRTILTVAMLGGDPSAFGTRPDGTTVDLLNDGVWNFAGELGAQAFVELHEAARDALAHVLVDLGLLLELARRLDDVADGHRN